MIFLLAVLGLLAASVVTACMDFYIWTGLAYIGAIALAFFTLTGFNDFVNLHGWTILTIGVPVYLVIGFAVAAGKWTLFMREFGAYLAEKLAKFDEAAHVAKNSRDRNLTALEGIQRKLYIVCDYLISYGNLHRFNPKIGDIDHTNFKSREEMVDAITPAASSHLDRFTFWVLEWPFVLIALVFRNFVLELITNFVNLFGGIFKRIGKYFVGNATANIQLY